MKIGPTYPEKQKKVKIKKCLLTLYPNTDVISTAVREKVDFIITYMMPSIWINQITDEVYSKMQILLENRIYIYKIPEEWISIKYGLIEIISDVLNLKITNLLRVGIESTQSTVIGRICQTTTSKSILIDLLTLIKDKLNLSTIQYLGDLDSPIQQIAIIIGHPLTSNVLKLVKRINIDTIICENFTYDIEKLAEELDIILLNVTKYIVNLGLLKLSQALRMEQPNIEFIFFNLKPSVKTF
ncbi:MAG: Nif3-like dinuclear metal center hexameric protein [Promethearchaeota archaeon]